MISDTSMVNTIKVRKVTQDVLRFLCHKHEIIAEQPSPDLRFIPEVTSELMNNLCNAVWIQSFLNDCLWEGFFQKHFHRMTFSLELFAIYLFFACYTVNENVENAYFSFFDTLSLVSYFVLRCCDKGFRTFLNMHVDLFIAFFEKELILKFEEEGGWENFNAFLVEQIDQRNFAHLIHANIRSFEDFHQRQDSHVEGFKRSSSLYVAALQKFTQNDVETHQWAVDFSALVASEMSELCSQTFEEILSRFAVIDCQVEDLYRQTVGVASGGSELIEVEPIQYVVEIESENISSNTTTENMELEPVATTSRNPETYDVQNSNRPNREPSYLCPTLSNSENIERLLADSSSDINTLSVIVKALCVKHGVQFVDF